MITEDSIEISMEYREKVAEIAHTVNRLYRTRLCSEEPGPTWAEAPDWEQRSVRVGVQAVADNPATTPVDSHSSWMALKQEEGWKHGDVKSAAKKEHPCLLPYDQLPAEQRMKDRLFIAVVRSLLPDMG